MTFSIVARDPASGRFGIAIQSCWPFVGAGCPWGRERPAARLVGLSPGS